MSTASVRRLLLLSPVVVLASFLLSAARAQSSPPAGSNLASRTGAPARDFDEAVDRFIANEQALVKRLAHAQPVTETYIQELKSDPEMGTALRRDYYFLAKLDLSHGIELASFLPTSSAFAMRFKTILNSVANIFPIQFVPRGFAARIFIDPGAFDRKNYKFQFVRREFLGDVRCIVVDVEPTEEAAKGRLKGRLWVEDRDYDVVRFQGTYGAATHGYLHFDSWRVNAGPHLWLPACIYTEETSYLDSRLSKSTVKGQTRVWGYETQKEHEQEAFTNLTVDIPQGVTDQAAAAAEPSPVEAQRMWQRQAEDNVIERLEQAGLISPPGEVDKVLATVLNNLEVSSNTNVEPPVRVRVMPTTPLESVPVGHTIVVSRGLIDVLPNEACLAAILAHGLAHILEGHSIDTEYAFADRLMIADAATLQGISLARNRTEEDAADQKALEILNKSPYKDKLPQVGLFLRMLSVRSDELPHLIRPLLGNRLADTHKDVRFSALLEIAPELQIRNTEQIAALPLGSRVKVDPWSDRLSWAKTQNVPLLSAREKMPFEVGPFALHLTREEDASTYKTDLVGSVPSPGKH
jgi:hypothetical protein